MLHFLRFLMNNYKVFFSIFLILFITSATLYPTVKNGFTNWDDPQYVIDNLSIRKLSMENIRSIFVVLDPNRSFVKSLYTPLTLMSYAIEYHFFGLNPYAYHMTNFVLHLLNCIILFYLFLLLTGNIHVSLIISIFFGIHPLHVESVAWIAERKDVLYSFFFLLTLLYYVLYRKSNINLYYYISLVLFFLSLLAKPMGITLPLILFFFDYTFFNRNFKKNTVIEKIPYFIIMFIFVYIMVILILDNGKVNKITLYKFNIFYPFYGLVFYLWKFLLPVKLAVIYPIPTGNKLPLIYILSPAIIIILISLIIVSGRYTKKIIFGSFFFFITILPVIKFIPVPPGITADRYTYIPYIGLFYLLGEGFSCLYKKNICSKPFLITILTIITGLMSILSWNRCHVWKDSLTLWNDTLHNYPSSLAYLNRGIAYADRGESDRALNDFIKTIELEPDYGEAYINRGNIYVIKGEFDKAINDFNRALYLKNDSVEACNNLGLIYDYKQEYEKALDYFTRAIEINKMNGGTYINRGNIYYKTGDYDRAVADYSTALTIDPDLIQAYINRALCYNSTGKYDKAIDDYNQVIKRDPVYIKAYLNRGIIYGIQKYYKESINDFTQVLMIEPDNKDALYNRGITYFNMGEYEKANSDIQKLQSLKYKLDQQLLDDLKKAL